MSSERQQLLAGIAALEAQRAALGDAVVDASLAGLRAKLSVLDGTPAAAPEQTLKQVSILFLDVVGSTLLSQHLDPEEVHAVMDGALVRCTHTVDLHQGKVLQYAGDNLLAVFGADEAREDDAERAVRCGLALLAEGRALGAEVRQRHAYEGFDVRVGVHTGGVLLGGGVDAEGSIRGIAVNIAARMEQTAPAGGLRISHDTYAQVRGLFDVEPQDPIAVKGVDEPVVTCLVLRARPRAFRAVGRGIEGIATRMVGRDAELAALQHAFTALYAERKFAMVTVTAEAGVGKSRLLQEFERWAESQPVSFRTVRGRAIPLTQSQPYGLLRDAIAWQMQIADSDSMQAAKHKLEARVLPWFEASDSMAQAHAHLLGHLIGLDFGDSPHVSGIRDDARQIRNRAFHAAALLLRRIATQGAGPNGSPVLLLLEDVHWADDGTLDLLRHLAEVDHDVPVLVLALARPTLFERRADWGHGIVHRRIDLGPLDPGASRQLVGELLKKLPEVPTALSELVAGRAEGNPFYMEELVKMLIDRGAIATAGAEWSLDLQRLLATAVPPSLTGVLQARLDGLPKAERLALQEASVIGPVFWDRALAALDPQAPATLPALVRRELALPRQQDGLDDVREYAFRHQILHHVTYATVLKRVRRALHARAARWLAALQGARAGDFLGATAEHFELAGDDAQACLYFARAAEHARARHAHDVALRQVERGLALLDGRASVPSADALDLRWRLLIVGEYALGLQGRRDEQRAALDALQEAADALDDDVRRALAARRRSMLGMRIADYVAQAHAAREALALAERAGDAESRLEAQRLLADALGAQGDHAAGEALANKGLAEARARGLRRIEGVFLNALSLIASARDDQVSGLALDLQDLPIWRELGDRHGEAVALGNVGADWLWFGDHVRARPYLEDALKLSRAIGARSLQCGPLGNLSQVRLRQGDAAQALAFAREALEIAVATQAADFEAQTLYRVGEAEFALGNLSAAAAAFEQAEALARTIDLGTRHDAIAGRARVAMAGNDVAAAMGLVAALLPLAARSDGLEGMDARLVFFTCHQVLVRAADPRANDLLARAHAVLQARAATIGDSALRASFLGNVPHHREIVSAWAAAGNPPAPEDTRPGPTASPA